MLRNILVFKLPLHFFFIVLIVGKQHIPLLNEYRYDGRTDRRVVQSKQIN